MKQKKAYRIYILDGNLLSLHIYEQHLRNLGYADVSAFSKATDCLSSLVNVPDIVFLENNISPETAVAILKKIKRVNPDIYVIFIAGLEDREAMVESLKSGAFEFIIRGEKDFHCFEDVIQKVFRVRTLLEKNNIPSVKYYI